MFTLLYNDSIDLNLIKHHQYRKIDNVNNIGLFYKKDDYISLNSLYLRTETKLSYLGSRWYSDNQHRKIIDLFNDNDNECKLNYYRIGFSNIKEYLNNIYSNKFNVYIPGTTLHNNTTPLKNLLYLYQLYIGIGSCRIKKLKDIYLIIQNGCIYYYNKNTPVEQTYPNILLDFRIKNDPEIIEYVKHCILFSEEIDPEAYEIWVDTKLIDRKRNDVSSLKNVFKKQFLPFFDEIGAKVIYKENLSSHILASYTRPTGKTVGEYKENIKNMLKKTLYAQRI